MKDVINFYELWEFFASYSKKRTIIRAWSKILASLIVIWQETEIRNEQTAWLCEVIIVFIRESAALSQSS